MQPASSAAFHLSSMIEGNDPAPKIDDDIICSRIENKLPVGDVSDDSDDTNEELPWRAGGNDGVGR